MVKTADRPHATEGLDRHIYYCEIRTTYSSPDFLRRKLGAPAASVVGRDRPEMWRVNFHSIVA